MSHNLETHHDLPLSAEQSVALQSGRPSVHLSVTLEGVLHPGQLHEALLQVIERHTSLHTALRPSNLYRSLRQHVVAPTLQWHVLEAGVADAEQQSAALLQAPFAIENGCLVRGILRQLAPTQWRLDLLVAACAGDRLSLQNLFSELTELYARPATVLEEAFQYSQYVEWRNDLDADDEALDGRAYWAALALADTPPMQLGSHHAPGQRGLSSLSQRLPVELHQVLQQLAERCQQPLGTVLQAAWWLLLARVGGHRVYTAGWQQDCRVEYEALANGIGVYEKILPLVLAPDLNGTFEQWLQSLASQLNEHAQQQEYWNVADTTHTHHRKVGFNLASQCQDVDIAGLRWHVETLPGVDPCFELALQVVLDEQGPGLTVTIQAPGGHYDDEALQCLLDQYACLLQSLPMGLDSRAMIELPLSNAEHQARQFQLCGPRRDFGSQALPQRLDHWAHTTPDAPALQVGDHTLSYRQLSEQVEQLAGALCARGIGRESKVALLLPRSADLLLGLFAVLRAGAAYIPLDPSWPTARQEKILADAQPQLLIGSAQGVSIAELQNSAVGALPLIDSIALNDAAYLLYTSGTSGEPKGVIIEHGHLLNYVAAVSEALDLARCKRFALISSVAADLGNTTLYGALWNGACMVLASDEASRDASAFAGFVRDQRIDCLKIVPSHLAALLEDQASALPDVVILGGEPCPGALRQRIQQVAPHSRVHNHYGPTETTVGVLFSHGQAFDSAAPLVLEQALANTCAYVLEQTPSGLQPAPLGALGEVYLGGSQVSRGYLNRASDAFIDDPFKPGQRLYRTGDLARLSAHGRLHLAGRSDQQIKIRGFRVEPGELEAALLKLAGVNQAVVHFTAGQLLAYAVSHRESADLLAELRTSLPDYLIPSQLLRVPALPRLANGKIDYAALPSPDSLAEQRVELAPRDALEALLADLYRELLERDNLSITDSLFDLGGHSLMVIKLCTRLRSLLQLEVPPGLVFDNPSVATLAQALRDQENQPGRLVKIAELRRTLAAMSPEERAALQARAKASSPSV
ncbi:amino acid adenylation domain-containing protein [Pseudomonas brassicacearum]|uniref:Amino acid adenylation domain-containing protein n=1 Tax=Pseudomonas brassicacearum TaxID=930166 RepID=A0AAW8M8H8_9PSED|nr:amino acid adenylation domain-containing protein [Pseudomonas brassicacearum]MDR6958090.1 amino acid adenylation domain-containing protein [Pseudomonas brassicacearum]